jgi:hypothetical protein
VQSWQLLPEADFKWKEMYTDCVLIGPSIVYSPALFPGFNITKLEMDFPGAAS